MVNGLDLSVTNKKNGKSGEKGSIQLCSVQFKQQRRHNYTEQVTKPQHYKRTLI